MCSWVVMRAGRMYVFILLLFTSLVAVLLVLIRYSIVYSGLIVSVAPVSEPLPFLQGILVCNSAVALFSSDQGEVLVGHRSVQTERVHLFRVTLFNNIQ